MAQEFTSYKNRLNDFGFRSGSFSNESGEVVNYEQLVIKCEIDGDIEEIVLSGGSAPKPKMLKTILKGARPQDGDTNGFLNQ